jgi:hypothetical protein
MRQLRYALAFIVCLLVLAGGWFLAANPRKSGQTLSAKPAQSSGSGILDGTTFSGKVTINGKKLDVIEKWVFAHGTFESTECALRCNYPRAPYFVRKLGDAIEFISESHCLDKDASIVWRGMVDGGTVKGTMTWTISRWYWTIERSFHFEGTRIERAATGSVN